jgi:uncharacterized protein YbbC (DUF1343 family)
MSTSPRVATGLDRSVELGFLALRGRRVGAICNPTSVDSRMDHLADLLAAAPGVTLAALFGPEHGIRADAQDMIGVGSGRDARTGVPVHSLYGSGVESLAPTPEQLDGLDVLVFDVQDVGSRYYTFAATMLYAMRAAARAGLAFRVLDRPNPIGGELVEGPTVEPGFDSFVGAFPLPIRHGMTVGELARMFRDEERLDLELDVVPCAGWTRDQLYRDTCLPWVTPSPNMPTPETALVYPGGCLVEGTHLSEGRGTTKPFELWGAPWLDPHRLAAELGPTPFAAGALLRPAAFTPMFHKHAGQMCLGVQPHVIDRDAFRPAALYAALLLLARAQDPDRFAWRTEAYEFVTDPIAIDLLFGSARERALIEAGDLEGLRARIADDWAGAEAAFRGRRAPYLLYP